MIPNNRIGSIKLLPNGETTEDITWYINGSTGNDTTGDGSVGSPFATFACLELLPIRIKHTIKIKVAAGTYTYFPEYLYLEDWGGKVIIDASGEAYPVVAGPFTATTIAGVGDVGPQGVSLATDITVSGESWTIDEYFGSHIHFLNQGSTGHLIPVFKNDADTIRTHENWYAMTAGLQFNIVSEPVIIDVNHPITLSSRTRERNAFLLFAGIRIEAPPSGLDNEPLNLFNVNVLMCFCSVVNVTMHSSRLNAYPSDVGDFDNTALNNVWSFGLVIVSNNGVLPTAYYRDISLYGSNAEIGMLCCRGSLINLGCTKANIGYTLAGLLESSVNGTNIYTEVFLETPNFSEIGLGLHDGYSYVFSVWVEGASEAINFSNCAGARLDWLGGAGLTSDYAIDVRTGCFVRVLGALTLTGTVGAIWFTVSDTGHLAWPTTGVSYTDSAGSYVTKE